MRLTSTIIFSLLLTPLLTAQVVTFDSYAGNAGFLAFAPAAGVAGEEDYIMDLSGTTDPSATTAELIDMTLVGGVDTDGGEILLEFFDAGGSLANSVIFTLPTGGNFIWTLTLPAGFIIPTEGNLRMTVDPNNVGGILGQWFLVDEVLATGSIGSSPGNPFGLGTSGAGNPLVFAFSLNIVATLPVDLTHFALTSNDTGFDLTWTTASEYNNMGFEVERAIDGSHFTTIGFVKGAGESDLQNDYKFTDDKVQQNMRYYYRLRQVDYDGQFEYSPMVNGMIKGKGKFVASNVIPNPAFDLAQITVTTERDQALTLSLYDAAGRQVQSFQQEVAGGVQVLPIDVSNLAAGTYFIHLVAANEVIKKKLIVR